MVVDRVSKGKSVKILGSRLISPINCQSKVMSNRYLCQPRRSNIVARLIRKNCVEMFFDNQSTRYRYTL